MCGRYNSHLPKMHAWTDMLQDWPVVRSSYNTAPSIQVGVVRPQEEAFRLQAMRWGMIPTWAKQFESKYATFNARIESVAEKPSFRNAWNNRRRCLVPMAGYYEWQKKDEGKQPVYITDRERGVVMCAALYERWGGEENGQCSCTILTRPAEGDLSAIHARMPVTLTEDSVEKWLSAETLAAESLIAALESPDLIFWPVSRAVGNVRNQDASLCEPIDL